MLKPLHSRNISAKIQKNIQNVDYMDGFCWQVELDLTLFYKIEGCWRIFLNPEIINDLNDRDLNDRTLWGLKMIMTLNDFDPSWPAFSIETKTTALLIILFWGERSIYLWLSLLIIIKLTPCSLSHTARYSERSSDSGQNADGYLQNCFPSVRFHLFKCLVINVYFVERESARRNKYRKSARRSCGFAIRRQKRLDLFIGDL